MNYYDLIKVGEKFLAKKKILRPKYESILLFSKINKINFNNYFINKKRIVSKTQATIFLKKIILRDSQFFKGFTEEHVKNTINSINYCCKGLGAIEDILQRSFSDGSLEKQDYALDFDLDTLYEFWKEKK